MDDGEFTHRGSARQGAPKLFRKRDGRFVAVHDEAGVTWLGNRHTALARDKDALCRARAAFQDDLATAFALFDARVDAAFEALRKALRP